MNTRRCLQIADAMHELLLRELSEGVDGPRMIAEPLYARDVLLVCDAMAGTEAATLAQQYRVAANERDATAARPSPTPDADVAGSRPRFGPTTMSDDDSFFGPLRSGSPSSLDPPAATGPARDSPAPARRWFSPSRWLGGR
jgi:hypothetical protein